MSINFLIKKASFSSQAHCLVAQANTPKNFKRTRLSSIAFMMTLKLFFGNNSASTEQISNR